jgi:hypothetical protein
MDAFAQSDFSSWSFVPRMAPGEKVEHTVDFSDRLDEPKHIVDAEWTADPDTLSITGVTHTDNTTTGLVGSGDDGTFYQITAHVEINNGEELERYLIVPVGNIYKEPEELSERRSVFMVRQFLRDRPDDNELDFGELQSSWDDLRRSVREALADWNTTTPPTDYDLDQFPTKARSLLYQRGAVETLRSAAQSEGRNQYQYSDQGFSAQEHSHGPMFMQFAQSLNKEYERKKKKLKLSINAQSMWGGASIDSAYADSPNPYDGHPGY